MRIIHLVSHPAQYAVPLYRLLYKELGRDFLVLYERGPQKYFDDGFQREVEWDADLACNYEWEVYPCNSGLLEALRRNKPDVLWLHGLGSNRHWLAMLWAFKHHVPVWLRGESSLITPAPAWKWAMRRVVLPKLFKRISCFLAIGSWNRLFYKHYGVPDSKIAWCPYAVDNGYWMTDTVPSTSTFILYVGKLQKHKGIRELINIALHRPYRIVFAGDGPLASEASKAGTVLGFVNMERLRSLYRSAACIVVPSHYEPWGLVVNEAMCAGKPVIADYRVNSAHDLVVDGITGYMYCTGELGLYTRLMLSSATEWNPEKIREAVSCFSYEADLVGVRQAINITQGG